MIAALMEPGLFTVVKRLAAGKDSLNRPVTANISRKVSDGRLEQTASVEGEAFVVNRYRAFFPISTDVSADDSVECRGSLYTVEGAPSVERVPGFPALDNIAAVLRYVGPVTP